MRGQWQMWCNWMHSNQKGLLVNYLAFFHRSCEKRALLGELNYCLVYFRHILCCFISAKRWFCLLRFHILDMNSWPAKYVVRTSLSNLEMLSWPEGFTCSVCIMFSASKRPYGILWTESCELYISRRLQCFIRLICLHTYEYYSPAIW